MLDLKRLVSFAVDARESPREVQSLGLQFVQVANVIEIEIQHRSVMFGGTDEYGRTAAEEKVVGIVGMESNRRRERFFRAFVGCCDQRSVLVPRAGRESDRG